MDGLIAIDACVWDGWQGRDVVCRDPRLISFLATADPEKKSVALVEHKTTW